MRRVLIVPDAFLNTAGDQQVSQSVYVRQKRRASPPVAACGSCRLPVALGLDILPLQHFQLNDVDQS